MSSKKRYRFKIKNVILIFAAFLVLLFLVIFAGTALMARSGAPAAPSSSSDSTESEEGKRSESEEGSSSEDGSDSSQAPSVITDPDDDWQLILVNPENALPDDFSVDLTPITAETYPDIPAREDLMMQIDSRIVDQTLKMFRDAEAEGIHLFLRASYRTVALQQTYYDWQVNNYMKQGYSEEDAIKATLLYTAYPGKSEHHTGLALDIISVEWQNAGKEIVDSFEETDEAKWLKDNAHKYGFIMRYPKDKESITEIGYEPWHFRYVGKAHAEAIYNSGVCLEEYLSAREAALAQQESSSEEAEG